MTPSAAQGKDVLPLNADLTASSSSAPIPASAPVYPPSLSSSAASLTPMLVQYQTEKAKYPDCLLFFRLGDFYELFFEDALIASQALQITLTQRGTVNDSPIPMCGVPFHAYEHYVKKLIKQGFRIALCEQTETPDDRQKNGGKGPLKREVVRVITPGTVVEEIFLESKTHNFLLSLAHNKKTDSLSCALLDLSTSAFILEQTHLSELFSLLSRYPIAELLVPDSLIETHFDKLRTFHKRLTSLSAIKYDIPNAKERLRKIYGVATLDSMGPFSDTDYAALGALVDYVELTQKEALPYLPFPKKQDHSRFLIIDHDTRANLEIDRSIRGAHEGSLLHTLDCTITNAGARLLQSRLSCPLQDIYELDKRLDRIHFFVDNQPLCNKVRPLLEGNYDISRSLSRLVLGKGGPRDLGHILGGLQTALHMINILNACKALPFHIPLLPEILLSTLQSALSETLPPNARDGGFVKQGFHPPLDKLRHLQSNTTSLLKNLQDRYRQETYIPTLRIKTNNVLGYFLECPPSQQTKIPDFFIHRQSLSSALRYTTPELNELASKITSAAVQAVEMERHLFKHWCDLTAKHQEQLKDIAAFLAEIDLSTAMAHLSLKKNYTRPTLTVESLLILDKGRHPVLDDADFTPNSIHFSEKERFFLITGPNMAGKSTYLRQTALITLMAQCGFYVPAEQATVGITDRIFSRIGAGDDLASGRSTFMVEMVETATILNQATQRSLVILDELGRGTSTYDGLSLAWAVTEHLAQAIQCRTVFATHYLELTDLEKSIPTITNMQMAIKDYEGAILFLHKIERGAANRSYGLHVAALSGVPPKIIARAEAILAELHKPHTSIENRYQKTQLILPLARTGGNQDATLDDIRDSLQNIDVHHLTPMKALTFLYEMKEKLKSIK